MKLDAYLLAITRTTRSFNEKRKMTALHAHVDAEYKTWLKSPKKI